MNLLFTGGGGAGNEAIFRLWNAGRVLHFADADVEAMSPLLPADRRHHVPMADDATFAEKLAALCVELGVDVLIPGIDEELPHMQAVADMVSGLRILVPESGYVTTMLDKFATAVALEGKGLDGPRTAIADQIGKMDFPCLAKPRWGRGSRGIQILREGKDLGAYLSLSRLATNEIVVQELLEGQEYTVMMAADAEGGLHAVVPVRVDVKLGITIRAKTEAEPVVIAACRAIHEALPTRGCYNIQLMLTSDQRALPFEINPRISTTFCLAVAAGVDPVDIFLGTANKKQIRFKSGVCLKRTWQNHFEEYPA